MASAEPIQGRCGAVVKPKPEQGRPGGYCEKWPLDGQTRCGTHGGKAPQVIAAAERRQQEQAAHEYMARYGVPQHIDWWDAIPQGINETYGNVLAMRDLVQQLAPDALTWGKSQVVEVGSGQFPGIDITQAAGIAPLVQLYGQERDRLHRMAVDAGKLNLEDRRVRVSEQTADMFRQVMTGSLRALDALLQAGEIRSVSPDSPDVQRVVASQLRALETA